MGGFVALVCACAANACTALVDSPDATFKPVGGSEAGASIPTPAGEFEFFAYLKATSPQPGAEFGFNLALDERAVAVAAPFEDVATTSGVSEAAGAAYVFALDGDLYAPIRLVAPNASQNDGQVPPEIFPAEVPKYPNWSSMNIGLNDHALVIGVAGEDSASADDPADNSAPEAGALYVYDRSRLGEPPQFIKAPNADAGDLFGLGLSVSGTRLAVGAPAEDSGDAQDMNDDSKPDSGAVYIYEQVASGFELRDYVKAPVINEGDLFGLSIALAGDLLVVGAPAEDGGSSGVGGDLSDRSVVGNGAAYIYRRTEGVSGADWAFEAYVKPSVPQPSGFFGFSLAVSGNDVAVGAPANPGCGSPEVRIAFQGAVYTVQSGDQNAWAVTQCFDATNKQTGNLFGYALAMNERRLAIGIPFDNSEHADDPTFASFSGAARLFERSLSGSFGFRQHVKAPEPDAPDTLGAAVAMSGNLLAVGAPQEGGGQYGANADRSDNSVAFAGAVFLFRSVDQ